MTEAPNAGLPSGDWRFPQRYIFETKRFETARKFVAHQTHGRCEIAASARKSFRHYGLSVTPLRRTSLILLSTSSECPWEAVNRLPEYSALSLHILLKGAYHIDWNGEATNVIPGDAVFLNDNHRIVKHHTSGLSQQIMLSFALPAFERVLREEFGVEMTKPLRFASMHTFPISQQPFLFDYIRIIFQDYFGGTPAGNHPALRLQNEKLLLSLLLRTLPHNYSDAPQLSGIAVPTHVKRAEDFLLGNYRHDLTLNDIVEAAGTSVRTLQYAFRDFRGTTPMRFLREVRLNVAHELILASRELQRPMGEIATDAGYTDLCRFSRDYKARFGEAPSKTRQRSTTEN